jgi:energy-converting hydrogenase Eha subunit F
MDTVAEFQKRRAKTWRHVRFSFLVMLASLLVLVFDCAAERPERTPDTWLCFIAFVLFAGTIVHITFAVNRFYRCPCCESVIQDSFWDEGGIPWDPDVCPRCHVGLK